MPRYDTLWKAILEDLFEDFLRFLYPNGEELFDFSKGFEFLDKELYEIFPNNEEKGVKEADLLVRVWLKDGTSEWILVHIEVQGAPQKDFTERMYVYNYRIRDKHKRRVTAWAIYTDNNKKFNPNEFRDALLGTELVYRFNTYKIANQNEIELKKSENPFAVVVLTALLNLKKGKTAEINLVDLKITLMKNLIEKKFARSKIERILFFLDKYVTFSSENTIIFEQKFKELINKSPRMGMTQLVDQWVQEKYKQGIEQGIEQGESNNQREVIRNARVKMKMSINKIAMLVNLTPERVREILDEMGVK